MLQTLGKCLLIGLLCVLIAMPLSAATIYFAPAATGSGNGTNCSNAYAWTDATHGITGATASWSAGNTLFICAGTYNCSAVGGVGNDGIIVGGSGSSGSAILVQGDTGGSVNFTCPAWDNAMFCSGYNYIIWDGGQSGVIQDTANGSPVSYPNSLNSGGISMNGCNHVETRNWTISNMYINVSGADQNDYGASVVYQLGSDYVTVHGINSTQASKGIYVSYSTLSSATIYNNTADYSRWPIVVIHNNNGSTASNVNIYGNTVGPHFAAWHDTACVLHMDGILVSASNTSSFGQHRECL